ncbi:hypothetical protein QE422_000990 [Chryseobacterium sp. SORGH_AS 447]|uniref:hypothetical protein n=1 Tax=Chryseobacterium sp. SORGH_AS_0447 TaxID=3041769 RepID=UPI00277D2BD8|nr:hypothetical protein [Chryseobacterium sp. SORGH_AS_0447]MDQ1160622.1 hypothetical protein [Chryseobacterium sp. SORGH_AS_0447]
MMQKDKYLLEFIKIKSSKCGDTYICKGNSIPGSYILGHFLTILSDREPHYLLEEIQLAMNNRQYEEYYSPDGAIHITIKIIPPNIEIDDFKMKLSEMK